MATPQKNNYNKSSLELLLDFQTRLQGVGNSLADDLDKLISSTDAALLKTIINNLPSAKDSVKHQMWRLNRLTKEIEKIRAEGFDLAEIKAFGYGSEVAKKAGSTVAKLADNRGKIFKKELSDKQISDVLNYHPIDGKSIAQWFHAMKTSDLERITQTVQRATVEGMSVAKVVKAIRGTKENDYKDGVLETTRNAATMTARTVINGVASNAMLETCVQNADIIDGIKFISTLDAKTCPFCGSYDGKIWKPEDAAFVKRPPLHPNCRCTVIPYVDMGENLEGERPAAAADFDKLAQDAYNKQAREKGWKRRFDDLSPSTRLKYYYQAQKDYTKQTGKPAYSQVKGDTTFKDYFENQPEAFQRSWLGPKRYELYKAGQYEPLHLANPDTGYVATLDELKKVVEPEPDNIAVQVPDWYEVKDVYYDAEDMLNFHEKNNDPDLDETLLNELYGFLPQINAITNNPSLYKKSDVAIATNWQTNINALKNKAEKLKNITNSAPTKTAEPENTNNTKKQNTDEQEQNPASEPENSLPGNEDFNNLKKVSNLGGSTGAELVEDENGNKYVLKRGGTQGNDQEGHVRNEYNVNQFYRTVGIDVPDGKLIDTPDGPALLSRYIEDGQTLSSWWSKASKSEKEEMRKKLRKGLAADILTGNWDVVGLGADNILVDKNGNPWRIDNGGALGYRAQGAKKTAEEWTDGFPDELWTMTGRGANIGNNQTSKITDYYPDVGLREIINDIDGQDWEEAIKTLPQEEQEIIRKRLDHIHKLAVRGNGFVENDYTEEYTEQILNHSYEITKMKLTDVLTDSIDEKAIDKGYKSSLSGFRDVNAVSDVPPGWETTHDKIVTAAKNINYHIKKGDTDYNQDKLDECFKLKPVLEKEAKNGDKTAQYYLDKIIEVENGANNNTDIATIEGPNAGKVGQKQKPYWEALEGYVNSSPLSSNNNQSYEIIKSWASAQAGNSYNVNSCEFKMYQLHSLGYDVTDKKKSVDEVCKELENMGFFIGTVDQQNGPNDQRTNFMKAIEHLRNDPDKFKQGCDAHARYQAGIVLALEKTNFINNDKDSQTVVLMRTEDDIDGVRGKKPGSLCTHKPGIAESFSQYKTVVVYAAKKDLTMVRVPYSRINGIWFMYRDQGEEMFMSDSENEFNVCAWRLKTYLVAKKVQEGQNVDQYMPTFESAEKKYGSKP